MVYVILKVYWSKSIKMFLGRNFYFSEYIIALDVLCRNLGKKGYYDNCFFKAKALCYLSYYSSNFCPFIATCSTYETLLDSLRRYQYIELGHADISQSLAISGNTINTPTFSF